MQPEVPDSLLPSKPGHTRSEDDAGDTFNTVDRLLAFRPLTTDAKEVYPVNDGWVVGRELSGINSQ